MRDNVYYLRDASIRRASSARSSINQLETTVEKLTRENCKLVAESDDNKETISYLHRLLAECQCQLQQLSDLERELVQRRSEVAILRYSLATRAKKA